MAVPAAAVSSTAWDCRPPTGSGTCPSPAGRTRSASSTSWHQVRQTSELLYRVTIVVRHYVYRVVNQVDVMLTSNSELPFSIRWGGLLFWCQQPDGKRKKNILMDHPVIAFDLVVPLSARSCLGWWKLGRDGIANAQNGRTSKSKSWKSSFKPPWSPCTKWLTCRSTEC